MKLGVLSDTHDNLANLRKAVEIFLENGVEAVLHAGDFCSPFTLPVFKPLAEKGVTMHAVFGNNDGDKLLLTRRGEGFCSFSDGICRVSLGGRRIILMHYPDVAEDLYRLGGYDLVIHGHDHKARVEGEGRKLLNPGTCSGYLADRASVALVDTEDLAVELADLP
jgi:putative phosphoesterase